MNQPLFTGVCTALVTPFLGSRVNYPMLEQLLARQVDAGIRAVVLSGTTGEAPTLSDAEKAEIFRRAKEFVGDACLIIAGSGSNDTAHAVRLSREAEQAGADALLVVTPYYNKSTSQGLIRHYTAIHNATSLPVILYNVPGRTGVDIPVSVYAQLSQLPRIVGVKEASTSIVKTTQILNACPEEFTVWSGNDEMAVAALALGSQGLVSVVSNLCPGETQAMAEAALDGDFDTAAAIQAQLQPVCELLSGEINPIPVKAAMKFIGFDCGECRLPLCGPGRETAERLKDYFA